MLQDSQFTEMLKEIETLKARKVQIEEDIKEVHDRYWLSVAGYKIRKKTTLKRLPELQKYIIIK